MKKPETYQELIAIKMCETIVEYYDVFKDDLEKIYNFLINNPKGKVVGNTRIITLLDENENIKMSFSISCRFLTSIDGFVIKDLKFNLLKHYTSGHGGYGGGSSGGSSSNNNNNNNNNR